MMHAVSSALLTIAVTLSPVPTQAAEQEALIAQQHAQAEQARSIIEAWRASGEGDVEGDRPLIVTLFTGSDTDPAPMYRERLTRTMQHIQQFYADEMERHGFGPLTFGLELEDDGLLRIHIVRGDRPSAEYNGDHGQEIRQLVNRALAEEGIDGNQQTVVMFCNLTVWDPDRRTMRHHSPYYAIGSSREGKAWQLDSALLDAAELGNTDRDQYLRDGQYGHISLGRYQSIFVGGVCHELGHAFGLPHNKERADERALWGTALMGSGNRTYGEELRDEGPGSFLTLAHAMKLAVHPGFTGSVREMTRRPRSRIASFGFEPIHDQRGVRLTGTVESDVPVHAVIAYLDPEGGSDYDATTHVAVPDAEGQITLDCTAFAGERGQVRIVSVHANGWANFKEDFHLEYRRNAAGQVEVRMPPRRDPRGALPDALGQDTFYGTMPVEPATPEPCPHCTGATQD
ncbi:MAG: hypothetical protein ACIAXF_07775 [Phycisphaerales bacterium JB063]